LKARNKNQERREGSRSLDLKKKTHLNSLLRRDSNQLRQQSLVKPSHSPFVPEDLLAAVEPVLVEDFSDDGGTLVLKTGFDHVAVRRNAERRRGGCELWMRGGGREEKRMREKDDDVHWAEREDASRETKRGSIE